MDSQMFAVDDDIIHEEKPLSRPYEHFFGEPEPIPRAHQIRISQSNQPTINMPVAEEKKKQSGLFSSFWKSTGNGLQNLDLSSKLSNTQRSIVDKLSVLKEKPVFQGLKAKFSSVSERVVDIYKQLDDEEFRKSLHQKMSNALHINEVSEFLDELPKDIEENLKDENDQNETQINQMSEKNNASIEKDQYAFEETKDDSNNNDESLLHL